MADITGTAKHLSTTSLGHMVLRLTIEGLHSKSGSWTHASVSWYVGAHCIASFQPRNGSLRLHVLISFLCCFYCRHYFLPGAKSRLLRLHHCAPWWLTSHGRYMWSRTTYSARDETRTVTYVHLSSWRFSNAVKNTPQPTLLTPLMGAYAWPACSTALPYDPYCGKMP